MSRFHSSSSTSQSQQQQYYDPTSASCSTSSWYSVLYTKQKTQKRKQWHDGKIMITPQRILRLFAISNSSLNGIGLANTNVISCSAQEKPLDETELSMQQLQSFTSSFQSGTSFNSFSSFNGCSSSSGGGGGTTFEMDGYLVQVEGPLSKSPPAKSKNPLVSNKRRIIPNKGKERLQKIMGNKFKIPPKVIPPPTSGARRNNNPALLRKRPLQPGELQQIHYGNSHDNGNTFNANGNGFNSNGNYGNQMNGDQRNHGTDPQSGNHYSHSNQGQMNNSHQNHTQNPRSNGYGNHHHDRQENSNQGSDSGGDGCSTGRFGRNNMSTQNPINNQNALQQQAQGPNFLSHQLRQQEHSSRQFNNPSSHINNNNISHPMHHKSSNPTHRNTMNRNPLPASAPKKSFVSNEFDPSSFYDEEEEEEEENVHGGENQNKYGNGFGNDMGNGARQSRDFSNGMGQTTNSHIGENGTPYTNIKESQEHFHQPQEQQFKRQKQISQHKTSEISETSKPFDSTRNDNDSSRKRGNNKADSVYDPYNRNDTTYPHHNSREEECGNALDGDTSSSFINHRQDGNHATNNNQDETLSTQELLQLFSGGPDEKDNNEDNENNIEGNFFGEQPLCQGGMEMQSNGSPNEPHNNYQHLENGPSLSGEQGITEKQRTTTSNTENASTPSVKNTRSNPFANFVAGMAPNSKNQSSGSSSTSITLDAATILDSSSKINEEGTVKQALVTGEKKQLSETNLNEEVQEEVEQRQPKDSTPIKAGRKMFANFADGDMSSDSEDSNAE